MKDSVITYDSAFCCAGCDGWEGCGVTGGSEIGG